MKMRIRQMKPGDVQAVSDLLRSCYRWLADREGYTSEQVDFLLDKRGSVETVRRESREQLYLVGCIDGAVAGMVSVAGNEVTKLYVTPTRHGHGLGARLLAAAASTVRESGFEEIFLGTTPDTVAFYESAGMSVAGTRRPTRGPFTDREVVIMTMRLDGAEEQGEPGKIGGREMRAPFQILVIPFRCTAAGFEFAVLKRSDADCWQFVAGGGEDDEDPLEAAGREAKEEVGITGELTRLDSLSTVPKNCFSAADSWGENIYVVPEYCFALEVGDKHIIRSPEHVECRWVSYEIARDLLEYDSNRTALWELSERLKAV